MLAFNTKGQIIRYDLRDKNFKAYDMPSELSSPVGIAIDNENNPWMNDHGYQPVFQVGPQHRKYYQLPDIKGIC